MTILNPNDATHALKIIPRFYPEGNVMMELTNEEMRTISSLAISPVISNGYMHLQFEQEFDDNSHWQVKITDQDEVVYRGKLFVTGQVDIQNYKITKDIFVL